MNRRQFGLTALFFSLTYPVLSADIHVKEDNLFKRIWREFQPHLSTNYVSRELVLSESKGRLSFHVVEKYAVGENTIKSTVTFDKNTDLKYLRRRLEFYLRINIA